jgi:hypothetical protein
MRSLKRFEGMSWAALVLLCAGAGCGSTLAEPIPEKGRDAGLDAFGEPDADADATYYLPPAWDGGAPAVVANGEEAVALALDSAHVYWQNTGGSVFACPLAGCAGGKPTLLSSLVGSTVSLETIGASDGVAAFLTAQGTTISSVAYADPGDASTTYTALGTSDLGVLVSDTTSVYFVDNVSSDGGASEETAIYACPLDGKCTSPRSLYTASTVNTYVTLGPLAVLGNELYVVEGGDNQALLAVPIHGGSSRTVCSSSTYELSGVVGIVAAGAYVYFTTSQEPTSIYQCATSGSSGITRFIQDYAPYALATDGANLYWTNYVPTTGTVATCALGATCTAPQTVAANQDSPFAIAANASSVFWSTTSVVYRADR